MDDRKGKDLQIGDWAGGIKFSHNKELYNEVLNRDSGFEEFFGT
jgi:hypothetical protein